MDYKKYSKEQEINYYIQGDAAKADQIKAAFEKLGYSTSLHTFFDEDTVFITLNGNICECNYGGAINELIKTHPDYKELELPVEPKFKVGNWYLCVKDFYGKGVRFDKGNTYHCGKDGCLQQFDYGAHISIVEELYEYFRLWTIADAKDGDVLVAHEVIVLFKEIDGLNIRTHFSYHYMNNPMGFTNGLHNKDVFRPATKDERELLFAKMKEAGYTWDEKKKEPKKILPHYDISNFHEGMPVLVRDGDCHEWRYVTFSHYRKVGTPFCAGGQYWYQCIPYNDDTKHLLGTTDMPSEEFINW